VSCPNLAQKLVVLGAQQPQRMRAVLTLAVVRELLLQLTLLLVQVA
jgi:hypothetical protein